MALPSITMIGNLTADVELRYTQSGKPVVNFSVACNERKKDDQGNWVDGATTFLRVVAWRGAEAIAAAVSKGTKVLVTGVLVQGSYETATGETKTTYEVRADDVATVLYDKTGQVSGAQSAVPADAWANQVEPEDTPF